MEEIMVLTFVCHCCGNAAAACPDCVVVVLIDPETGLPPDIAADGQPRPVDPAAVARANRVPVCDRCVEARNASPNATSPWPTAEASHRLHAPRGLS